MTKFRLHVPRVLIETPDYFSAARRLGIAAGVGLLFGLMVQGWVLLPGMVWLAALGGPWLLVAFLMGARDPRLGWSMGTGAVCLATGTVAYYFLAAARDHVPFFTYALPVGTAWMITAMISGGAFGLAGWMWRYSEREGMFAALGATAIMGALAGEAAYLASVWEGTGAYSALGAQAILVVVLWFILKRNLERVYRSVVLILTLAMALVCALAESQTRHLLEAVGWLGM